MKMTLKERDEWIRALLSGKYKQGKRALHKVSSTGESSFCCLGVLCDLYKSSLKLGTNLNENLGNAYYITYDSDQSLLPDRLVNHLETWSIPNNGWSIKCLPKWKQWYIKTFKSQYLSENLTASLIDLNDDIGLSFKDIAKVIKHNVIIKEEPVT